ncbi:MAG: DUF2088 domain-containing protein [FCB group bacterium]|nr:DUF2088 domain-containing protein [FCB group bacterium]
MPEVAFGVRQISFELESGDSLTEKEPADSDCRWNRESFRRVLDIARFDDFLTRGKPLVVVNDAFRPTPTGKVLSHLKNIFPDFEADYIVACGNHPAPDKNEVAAIFEGFNLGENSQLFFHDSRDTEAMVVAGELEGQQLLLNRRLFEYSSVIVIGSVEPHYFAGYTGGRKSIVPGLCDVESTRRNHALAVSVEAQPTRLAGNPVAEHLNRLLDLAQLPPLFSIQVVAGRDRNIIDCFCGDLKTSFAEAVAASERIYAFETDKLYDLVVAEMRPPLDRNLYQLQKAIENCAAVVRDDGTIVAVSPCSEGVGNEEFYRLAAKLQNEEMVLSRAELEHPPLGMHKLSRMVSLSRRIGVKVLTGLKREIVEQVFLEPVVSLEAEMQKLRQTEDKRINILLVRDAGQLVAKRH